MCSLRIPAAQYAVLAGGFSAAISCLGGLYASAFRLAIYHYNKNHAEIHARPPDCTKYRQYPVFNGSLCSGCFPLCQYSVDALYRILYQYSGCLHSAVRSLRRILSRQIGGLPDQQKVVSAPDTGLLFECDGADQRPPSFSVLHCAGGTPAEFVFSPPTSVPISSICGDCG